MSATDLVVGEVGFGPSFASNPVDNQIIADLRAQNRELIRRANRLKRVLMRCAALSDDVANEKHEALLEAGQPLEGYEL
jgi:hypothetical protein